MDLDDWSINLIMFGFVFLIFGNLVTNLIVIGNSKVIDVECRDLVSKEGDIIKEDYQCEEVKEYPVSRYWHWLPSGIGVVLLLLGISLYFIDDEINSNRNSIENRINGLPSEIKRRKNVK